MITLYGRRNSSNVQRAVWALEEIGVAYERVTVGGSFGGTDTPAYRAMNPTGLVPTLVDTTNGADLTLWESEAIMRYLAARYGDRKIWPSDPLARALGDQWVAWSALTQQTSVGPLFYAAVRTGRAEKDAALIDALTEKANAVMTAFDRAIAGGPAHLGGEAFFLRRYSSPAF